MTYPERAAQGPLCLVYASAPLEHDVVVTGAPAVPCPRSLAPFPCRSIFVARDPRACARVQSEPEPEPEPEPEAVTIRSRDLYRPARTRVRLKYRVGEVGLEDGDGRSRRGYLCLPRGMTFAL